MHQSQTPSNHRQVLHRPRLNALIHDGLQRPLLVVLAGPGYGKMQAMSDYVSQADADTLWVRLGALDNLANHFWDHLLQAMMRKQPALSARLHEVKFPESISDQEIIIQMIEEGIPCQRQTIWILDDYGEITNQQVKDFVRILVEANIERFHLVLMSSALNATESIAFMSRRRSLLMTEDLCFTKDEIRDLYQSYGIELRSDDLNAVWRYTEGWPLPLNMLVMQHDKFPDMVHQSERLTNHTISFLFEERFF